MRRYAATILCLLLFAACTAGRNFPHATRSQLTLAQTTAAEALRMFGTPASRDTKTIRTAERIEVGAGNVVPAGGSAVLSNLRYDFSDSSAPGDGSGLPWRLMYLTFLNERLVGVRYSSTFLADSTKFDDSRISELVKGRSTAADVKRIVGAPSGETLLSDGKHQLCYDHYARGEGMARNRRLTVTLDVADRVVDFDLQSEDRPLPPPAATGATVIPIIVPRGG